jgi:hypothetical protein
LVAPAPSHNGFGLGRIVATPGALDALERSGEDPLLFVARHGQRDWGDICAEDRKLNDAAVAHENDPELCGRVLSAYATKLGERLWVITEADRSATTLLLPDEY